MGLTTEQRARLLIKLRAPSGGASSGFDSAKFLSDVGKSALGDALKPATARLGGKIERTLFPQSTLGSIRRAFGPGRPGRQFMALAGLAALTGGAVNVGSDAVDSIRSKMKHKSNLQAMLNEYPELKKEPKKDVSRIFRTLHKFNPDMASDPLVASSFVKRQLEFKDVGIQPTDVKTLSEVGKNLGDAKRSKGQGLSSTVLGGPSAEGLTKALFPG